MFDHVEIRVSDRAASERFYDTVLGTLGLEPREDDEVTEWGDFGVASASDARPVTRRLHVAFFAPSRGVVDAFWRAGVEAGYPDDGAPGLRPQYSADYYGGFVLDPDGIRRIGSAVVTAMAGGADLGDLGRDIVEKQVAKRVGIVIRPTKVASWDHSKMSALPGAS